MIRHLSIVTLGLLCASFACAQSLERLMGSVPAAVCEVAPLPPAMAAAKAKLENEKKQKLVRQGNYLPAISAKVNANVEKFVTSGQGQCAIVRHGSSYTISTPVLSIRNTSHGRENIESGSASFNIKKDRMSYAVLQNGNAIVIINHKNKPCDMSDFTFTSESNAIRMNGNKIEVIVPTLNIAAGDYPVNHKVVCRYNPSDVKYTFDIHMDWRSAISCSGADCAYSFDLLGSDTFPDLALMCDLKTNRLEVVHLPFTFYAAGYDGSNGRRGSNGRNGRDEINYKDSDGKTHYVKGTCAQPGGDGSDGTDGTDGGTFLFCVSEALLNQFGLDAISAWVDAGKGGKGGAGGKGGIHGKGSGCSGKAPDGKPGRDGRNGKRGDFLYIVADVNGFYLSMFGK